MSGTLFARLQRLASLSQSSLLTPERAEGAKQSAYGEALRLMWGGQFVEAAAVVSQMLAEDPEASLRFPAYRLWIEALAEQGDKASLRAVRDMLLHLGQAEPEAQTTFASLRGLAHFELDEINAARLIARSMTSFTKDPYCLELCQAVDGRKDHAVDPKLSSSEAPLADYFHWQALARGLLRAGKREELNLVLACVREQCPAASLAHQFEFHLCIDSGFFAAAALVAERLTELYPKSLTYGYYRAYALFEDGDYPSARKTLVELVRSGGNGDAEIVGLLGQAHAKLGDAEQAVSHLKRAAALLKAEGLPTSHISLELADVEEELRGEQLDPALTLPRATRKWLVNLSPRRYHELLTSAPSAVDRLLRPMGPEPRPGDICFFATMTKETGHLQWKIVGIYAVDSDPIWHPTSGYHSALRLVARLPDGLPVDMEIREEPAATPKAPGKARDQHLTYGVYELDNYAIDIIEEAVQMSREDMIERRRGSGQSRRPTA